MKKFYFETYGCQMNKYDSELVAGILLKEGYQQADSIEEADIALINTCSVRQHAENRVFGRLDAIHSMRKENPQKVIGLLGCMAVRLKDEILNQKPFVNFIMGPDHYRNIIDILNKLDNGTTEERFKFADFDSHETYSELYPSRSSGVSAWIAIMRGCNNFCTYCIVPYLRGRERSRPVNDIEVEVRKLIAEGFIEVTLLGQNVNSYHDGQHDFSDLIHKVADIEGISRVRFATSHPKDISEKLIDTMINHPKICNHLHLPVQSGSDNILKLMNRNYTRSHYLKLVKTARSKCPELGLYSDFIVGFPGETESDFEDTVDLVKQAQFDGIFVFKYSPREGTAAYKLQETLSEEEKVDRLKILNQLQNEITLRRNKELVGSNVAILVEGVSKKAKPNQYMGRTETNKIVVFTCENPKIGSIVDVKITDTQGHTLFGKLVIKS